VTTVDVVIVNWNAGDYLRRAVESLAESRTTTVHLGCVTVVDNASADGSVENLPEAGLRLQVLHSSTNLGFAAGCNLGARYGNGDFVLFLNPDAAVEPDAVERSAQFMQAVPDVAVCGGRVVENNGLADHSCSRLPTLRLVIGRVTRLTRLAPRWFPATYLKDSELSEDQPVQEVIGAYFFVRRSIFEQLGGFDERYFLYYEEVDLCRRALDLGYRVYYLRDVGVRHVGRVSSDQVKAARLFHSLYSRSLYARRHWPGWQADVLVVVTYLLELPARLAAALVGRGAAREVLAGYRMLALAQLRPRLRPSAEPVP
jgi:N-acetylglucosaminyl-diphospho-decaprenol L-rhamnosyltransferase